MRLYAPLQIVQNENPQRRRQVFLRATLIINVRHNLR